MQLRHYQSAAIDALLASLKAAEPAPLVELPTGAGKSPVVAELCRRAIGWNARVIVVVHVKELVEQLANTTKRMLGEHADKVGIVSAGLGERDYDKPIVIGGIQSCFRQWDKLGKRNLVIVDEAHLIPADGDGMYRTLMDGLRAINPSIKVCGLTATPYRLDSGSVVGDNGFFSSCVYRARVADLMTQDAKGRGPYLSRVRCLDIERPDLSQIHTVAGEWNQQELDAALSDTETVDRAVKHIVHHGNGRRGWLVFAVSVHHASMVRDAIEAAGISAGLVTGETPTGERDRLIADFKAMRLRCLVNVSVLTTGFDAPHVDLVAMLRPTKSPGLYYQMLGRGFRMAEGKGDCLLLDMAGNVATHGPIDTLNERIEAKERGEEGEAPAKTCPQCKEYCGVAQPECPNCGHAFKRYCPKCKAENEWGAQFCGTCASLMRGGAKHGTVAEMGLDPIFENSKSILVSGVSYRVHFPKDQNKKPSMRVEYRNKSGVVACSEFICFDHDGYAKRNAIDWHRDRSVYHDDEHPTSVEEAVAWASTGRYRQPWAIVTAKDSSGYDKVLKALMRDEQVAFPTEVTFDEFAECVTQACSE